MVRRSKSGSWSRQKTRDELLDALRRQIANLKRSCSAFDEGAIEEAERLAVSIHVLVAEGGQQSLLQQLDLKQTLRLPTTVMPVPPGIVCPHPPMLFLTGTPHGVFYGASKDIDFTMRPWLKFSKWWDETIYNNQAGQKLSRKNLTYWLRSQDGGGHVGHRTDEAYDRYARVADHYSTSADGAVEAGNMGGIMNQSEAHLHTMRQIAIEFLIAFDQDSTIQQALAEGR